MRKKNAYRTQAKKLRALLQSADRGLLERRQADKLELLSVLMEVDGAISLQSLRRLADAPFKEWDALALQMLGSVAFFRNYQTPARQAIKACKKPHYHLAEATVFWKAFSGEKVDD